MSELLKAPVTPAQQARDALLGALVGLARATTSEPKTDDTDEVLNAGLRLAAQPDAPEERLQRMLAIVQTEKHRVAPAAPPVPCPAATRTITILSACGCAREYPHPQAANAFCRVCAGPKAPAGSDTGRRLSAAVHSCRGLGRGASCPCCATRQGALPGVNPGRKAAAFTRRVCSGSVPGTNQKGPPFLRVFVGSSVILLHQKCIPVSFTPDFLPFSESFLQKKTLQTIFKNILYK